MTQASHLLKPKSLKILRIRRGEVGDAVVAEGEGEGEAGVDEVAEVGGGLGGSVPEGFADSGSQSPNSQVGLARGGDIAEGGGFPGGLGLLEDGGIAELQVKLHQHAAAEQESLPGDLLLEEAAAAS